MSVLPLYTPSGFTLTSSAGFNRYTTNLNGGNVGIKCTNCTITDSYGRFCNILSLDPDGWYHCGGSNGLLQNFGNLSAGNYELTCSGISNCSENVVLGFSNGSTYSFTSFKGNFTPVVEGLQDTFNEFIPYVLYIGIGVLSAIIGFVGIKYLINRVREKVLNFK